jgi:anti-sigma B factor antagonist
MLLSSLDVLPGSASSLASTIWRAAPHLVDATTQEVNLLEEQSEAAVPNPAAGSSMTCVTSEQWSDGIGVVAVSGVVDMLTAPVLEDAIRTALAKDPVGLVVDFTAVEFLASAGMGILVAVHDEVSPGIAMCVVADGPATSRPLKLLGIADIIALYATVDEAIAALRA